MTEEKGGFLSRSEADRLIEAAANLRQEQVQGHERQHAAEALAVQTALAAVARERAIHAQAHEREHGAHQREHGMANLAIDKAEAATDKRFASYREGADGFVQEVDRRFDEGRKETERRFDELRGAIAQLERTDVKAEGKGVGQNAIIAYVVAAFSVMGSLIVVINVLSGI